MKPFQRGQIWLVNFDPSFGHEYKKIRPALIVQHDRYIPTTTLLTVIPLSSQLTKRKVLDVLITKDAQNRLMKDSLLKTSQISSFDKRRFIKYVGTLNDMLIKQIDTQIQSFLFGKEQKIMKTNTEITFEETTSQPHEKEVCDTGSQQKESYDTDEDCKDKERR